MIRDEFEKLHPVPFGVVFADDTYVPENPFLEAEEWATMRRLSEKQQHLWQGFQAGHAAGLEDAAQECERLEPDTRSRPGYVVRAHDNVCAAAAAIRAMKGEVI